MPRFERQNWSLQVFQGVLRQRVPFEYHARDESRVSDPGDVSTRFDSILLSNDSAISSSALRDKTNTKQLLRCLLRGPSKRDAGKIHRRPELRRCSSSDRWYVEFTAEITRVRIEYSRLYARRCSERRRKRKAARGEEHR